MGLFGLPTLPPEVMALIGNPKALGEQVKAFYIAATALLAAVDQQRRLAEAANSNLLSNTDFDAADADVWKAADAFRAEMAKLPPLNVGPK